MIGFWMFPQGNVEGLDTEHTGAPVYVVVS